MTRSNERRAHADAVRAVNRAASVSQSWTIAKVILVTIVLAMVVTADLAVGAEQLQLACKFWLVSGVKWLMSGTRYNAPIAVTIGGTVYLTDMQSLATSTYVGRIADAVGLHLVLGGVAGLGLGLVALAFIEPRWRRNQDAILADRVVSGTRQVGEKEPTHLTAGECGSHSLKLGLVAIPPRLVTRHLALAGSTGSGKTTALRQLLDAIERSGDAALVYDTSGEFVANYYDPSRGDQILDPLDSRSCFWGPLGELSHPGDADGIAQHLITPSGDRDHDVWLEMTRILVANILRTLWQEERYSLPDLLRVLKSMSREDMERWLVNTSSARIFSQDAERATASCLFMLSKACNLLAFLRAAPREGENGFSFSEFFPALDTIGGKKPWIFVPRHERYFAATRPLLSLWLECAASATLGLTPSSKRRIFFVLDELSDLPKVDNLVRLLAEGRKFGAAVILTFQAIGQMRARYGHDIAEAILGCCNTKLFLQLGDKESREWASETIGVSEIEVATETSSLDPKTGEVRKTLGRTRQQRQAVLESELRLAKYQGYLLLPDGFPVAKIALTDAHIRARGPARQPAYVPADISETLWGAQQSANAPESDTLFATPGPV